MDWTTKHQPAFADDDYEAINKEYFDGILSSGEWSALPVGWLNPHVEAAKFLKLPDLDPRELGAYAVDEGRSLEREKNHILALLSDWEGVELSYDAATLCPSVSTATAVVLKALKARGFKNIVFETPAYFATVDQARSLGLNVIQIPSYVEEDFCVPESELARIFRSLEPCVFWITHPRFVISNNRTPNEIDRFLGNLGERNMLVVDEASEQCYPSVLGVAANPKFRENLIRIRGLVKGVGLNGLRISTIFHSEKLRSEIIASLDQSGASIDRYSLFAIQQLASNPNLFRNMLAASRNQVKELNDLALSISRGSPVAPFKVDNGYMSAVVLKVPMEQMGYALFRTRFLEYCRDNRMPVVLRASMNMAMDERWEGVRVNYFTSRDNIRKTVENLVRFYSEEF